MHILFHFLCSLKDKRGKSSMESYKKGSIYYVQKSENDRSCY